MRYLCITVRFLDPFYEGFKDKEYTRVDWPPSPLRCFQALIRGAKDWERAEKKSGMTDAALQWLGSLPAPLIIAPPIIAKGIKYGTFVPVNDVNPDGTPQKGAAKKHQPIYLAEDAQLRYLWPLSEDTVIPPLVLDIPKHMVNLGRGTVLVMATGEILDGLPPSQKEYEIWSPDGSEDGCDNRTNKGTISCQVPNKDTFEDTEQRYCASLAYIHSGIEPVRITKYDLKHYKSQNTRKLLAHTVFHLDWNPSSARPNRGIIETAGMLRHAAASAMREQGEDDSFIRKYILGHVDDPIEAKEQIRLAFLPLPSYQVWRGGSRVGGINRVMITSFHEGGNLITDWTREYLQNYPLIQEESGLQVAVLSSEKKASSDFVTQQYTRASQVWATVTPVLLPGHDDPGGCRKALKKGHRVLENSLKMDTRIDYLIRKAFLQAGYPKPLVEAANFEFQKEGFFPGTHHCKDYTVSRHHISRPRYHVRVTWPRPINGPICVGDGRFYGMGLFLSPV